MSYTRGCAVNDIHSLIAISKCHMCVRLEDSRQHLLRLFIVSLKEKNKEGVICKGLVFFLKEIHLFMSFFCGIY